MGSQEELEVAPPILTPWQCLYYIKDALVDMFDIYMLYTNISAHQNEAVIIR